MKVLILIFGLLSFAANAKTYKVVGDKSKVDWHLYIESNTDVYGEIPVSGEIDLGSTVSGKLIFDLKKTKSYELDKENKKELSSSRDDRIYKITGADRRPPQFEILSVEGFSDKKSNNVKIKGKLSLNGVTKDIATDGVVTSAEDGYVLTARHKINWEEYNIDNPVIWIMRVAKKADPFITVNFKIYLN